VKFGPVTLEISMLNRTHPKCIFRKTIFRPLGGTETAGELSPSASACNEV